MVLSTAYVSWVNSNNNDDVLCIWSILWSCIASVIICFVDIKVFGRLVSAMLCQMEFVTSGYHLLSRSWMMLLKYVSSDMIHWHCVFYWYHFCYSCINSTNYSKIFYKISDLIGSFVCNFFLIYALLKFWMCFVHAAFWWAYRKTAGESRLVRIFSLNCNWYWRLSYWQVCTSVLVDEKNCVYSMTFALCCFCMPYSSVKQSSKIVFIFSATCNSNNNNDIYE